MGVIKIEENVSLKNYTTMRVGGPARYLAHIDSKKNLVESVNFAKSKGLSVLVIGSGSNTIFTDVGYAGLVLVNEIRGIDVIEKEGVFYFTAGAGEVWDNVVAKSVELDLTGIEAITMVPGTAGAAPVQNIGCYGQELADTLIELEAYDLMEGKFVTLSAGECEFLYRTSIFRPDHPHYAGNKYIVVSITLGLRKGNIKLPLYTTLQKFFDKHGIKDYSPRSIREALKKWRSVYLPNPAEIANCGSFFKNPIVDEDKLAEIISKNPDIKDHPTQWYWKLPNGKIKIAAGRLAEMAGLKDWHDHETGMATWKTQALLFVNENARSYSDLALFEDKYLKKIQEQFGVAFEEEVRVIK